MYFWYSLSDFVLGRPGRGSLNFNWLYFDSKINVMISTLTTILGVSILPTCINTQKITSSTLKTYSKIITKFSNKSRFDKIWLFWLNFLLNWYKYRTKIRNVLPDSPQCRYLVLYIKLYQEIWQYSHGFTHN